MSQNTPFQGAIYGSDRDNYTPTEDYPNGVISSYLFSGESSYEMLQFEPYDVYIRIHNNSCLPINNIKVKIFVGEPSMLFNVAGDDDGRESITVSTDGDYLPDPDDNTIFNPSEHPSLCPEPSQFEDNWRLIGPFQWAPQRTSHICLIALVDSDDDHVQPILQNMNNVKEDNNKTQRNIENIGTGWTTGTVHIWKSI